MKRRSRLTTYAALAAALVALLIALWHRDDAEEAQKPAPQQQPRSRKPLAAARAAPLPAAALMAAQHLDEPPPSVDEVPKSGPERLYYLKVRLGSLYAGMTLMQDRLEYLQERGSSEADRVREQLRELEATALQHAEEIKHFDVNAPPVDYSPHRRTGPPIKVSSVLSMTREQWGELVSKHSGQRATISQAVFDELRREVAEEDNALGSLVVPSGLAGKVQEEFLLVVDALIQSETERDRTQAQRVLEARWEEFLRRVRELSAGS